MRKLNLLSTLILAILYGSTVSAQDFSNKGKDFYLCFPAHVPSGNNLAKLSIWITSDKASSGTVTMTNGAFTAFFSIQANGLAEIQVPYALAHISNGESNMVIKKSIRVKTDAGKPAIVAYVQQWAGARSAATLLLPVTVLGKKYYSMNFFQNANSGGRSQFQVIATKNNTTVKISPVFDGVKQSPFNIDLPAAGDMYQFQATSNPNVDLTGTIVESVASNSGACVPIAVFSGSSNLAMGTNSCSNFSSFDPLFQQLYPITSWGKNFGFIPFANYPNGVPYRVIASENNTTLSFNGGQVAILNAGDIYPNAYTAQPMVLGQPTRITADKPICVAQYAQSNGCSGAGTIQGDPDMVILNPIEQSIQDITIFSTKQQVINSQYINILLKTNATASFRISRNGGDLSLPTSAWQPFAALPGYSYLREQLPTPGTGTGSPPGSISDSYRLLADSGFNAIAYGWGDNESYAYSAGTNIKDLYTSLGITTPYGAAASPSACVGTGSRIKISLPYKVDSIWWQINALPGNPLDTMTRYPPSVIDSIRQVNGKDVYWYSLPRLYVFNTPGTYPVTITTFSPVGDGCGSEQEYSFEMEVYPKPISDFTFTTDGCVTNPVQFTDASTPGGRPVVLRHWNFGDATTASTNNPSHTYATAGAFNVKYSIITDIGCKSDTTTKVVNLSNPPTANFTTTGPYCEGNSITFTDGSTAGVNSWLWDFGDASPTSTTQNPTHTYALPGVYTVSLTVGVGTCMSQPKTFNVTIRPKPVSAFSFPSVVCLPSGSTQFTDNSTVAPNPANTITSWLWNFGDATPTSTLQNPVHVYSGTGPYNVTLTVTTNHGCKDDQVTTMNSIYAQPQAAFNNLPAVCIGSLIGFSDASTAPGSSVTGWLWNFGDASPTSNLQNPSHIYAAAGTYTVTLTVTSAVGCASTTNTASHQVTVNPLPTASLAGNNTVCKDAPFPNVTFTGGVGTAPFTFTYTINNGPAQTVVSVGNTAVVPVTTATAGTFTYTLVSVKDNSSTQCAQPQSGSAVVTVKALPTASISGTTSVCLNGTQPQVVLTGTGGTAPYTFVYNLNNGAPITVSSPTGTHTINVPTNVPGVFNYNLVSVQESSAQACSQQQTGTATVEVKTLPTASISGSNEVCVNATTPVNVVFTGAAGAAPYTFTYRINGGPVQTVTTTSGNSVPVLVPTNVAGTFTYELVSVREGSSSLCSQAQTGSATVVVNPLPTGDFTYTIPTCNTRVITFTDASVPNAGALNSWEWNFGDPTSANNTSTAQNPTHTFTGTGNFTVTLIVKTDKGCIASTVTKQVVVNARPKAGFITPVACVNDQNAQFTDTSKVEGGTIVAWEWNFGDANANAGNPNTSNLQNPTHWFTVMGNYTVQLISTSNNGCRDTVQQTFFVNGNVLNADFQVKTTGALCSNKEFVIEDASSVEGNMIRIEIYWDYLNDPTNKTDVLNPVAGTQYTHTYPEFGTPATRTYQVRYVVYTGENCVNTLTRNITMLATPSLVFASVPAICSDASSFQVTQASITNGLPGGPGVFSGTGITSAGLFSPSVAGAGQHTIRFTFDATNGCSNFVEQVIEVNPTPGANAGPDKVVLEGGQVMLTPAQNASMPVTYSWTPATYLSDASIAQPNASPVDDITYTLTVTSDKGCADSDEVFVKVLKAPAIPNIFSPNGDGIHDKWVIQYLETYPGCTVDIYNRYGQVIFHSVGYTQAWDGTVNGKPVPVGTYYYIVNPKNGRSQMAGYVDVIR